MRQIFGFFLAVVIFTGGIAALAKNGQPVAGDAPNEPSALNYLLFGVDDAGANTDVILLLGYRFETNALTVMQLPRDTYIEVDGRGRKMNSIYANRLQEHGDRKQALQETSSAIAAALHIPIDGALLFGLSAFSGLVDRIGGVPINIPFAMEYHDDQQGLTILLPAGETVLDGKRAEQFVRFRSAYLEGDVGRLDAQKLFMFAFLKKAMEEADFSDLVSLVWNSGKDAVAQGDVKSAIKIAADAFSRKNETKFSFLTLPGTALYDEEDATWYYVMNRDGGIKAIETYFYNEIFSPSELDEKASFYKKGAAPFENIYFAADMPFAVYTPDNMEDIIIKKKE